MPLKSSVQNKIIEVIRGDHVVGRGTCSAIDECYSDKELLASVQEAGITNAMNALRWARQMHRWDVMRYQEIRSTAF